MLQELGEVGMELVRDLRSEAASKPVGELVAPFVQLARAVRQTIALEAHLAEGGELKARQASTARRESAQTEYKRRIDHHRDAICETIERLDDAGALRGDLERLDTGLGGYLYGERDYDLFLNRSVAEIIVGICKDLGLACDLGQFTDADWIAPASAQTAANPRPLVNSQEDSGEARPPDMPHAGAERYEVEHHAQPHRRGEWSEIGRPP